MREGQMLCPNCGRIATCESVNVGVGLYLRGDFACSCGWELDGPDDHGFLSLEDADARSAPLSAYEGTIPHA